MKRCLLLILTILAFAGAAAFSEYGSARADNGPPDDCYSTVWPHENSALEPDPALHFGRLDNGFRYVLIRNAEPRDRVGIYLDVEAGSLYERENERGLAHFLEHMLFNGTTHYPPGELIDFFQSIGMGFGADVNGYTTYTDTVYKLLLPAGSKDSLDQGFLVMRDYADGALLLEEEIDRERGIILAEKAARDSAAYRSRMARTAFLFKNTPIPRRSPIGETAVLESAGRQDLLGFYQRWYRPDNMILVVVGDFNRGEAEKLIVEHFDSMRSKAAGECPDYGSTAFSGTQTFYHYEPELGGTDVIIETIENKTVEHDSLKLQQEHILTQLASMIINQRLNKLSEAVGTPFISANYYESLML
ncbi:MAG: pitrilysin family protein, partial [Desulfofustis sp.]